MGTRYVNGRGFLWWYTGHYSMEHRYDLIVVGGGASGMMAAGRAAERGLRVLLLEKNARLGEKLRISGGGRCNILNAEEDERLLLAKYGEAEQFLYSLFVQFGMRDAFGFFESRGLPLVIEDRKRAFPQSERAEDVVTLLLEYLRAGKVEVKTKSPVTDIEMKDGCITGVVCGARIYTAQDYIFATGSLSHPETGSSGDGFLWLQKLGHTVTEPTPTIVPLKTTEAWSHALRGVSAQDAKITFCAEGIKRFTAKGNILFTHFGLSGPVILNLAHKVADLLHEGAVTATIDLYPDADHGSLEQTILAIFDMHKNKALKNVLGEFLPEGMGKGIGVLLGDKINLETKVHSVAKEDRKWMVQILKALPLTIEGLMGFDRAVVADGGVPLSEIDMKTMRSKKVPHLLITGDLLHINRPSGGYSLQLCWTTGYVAGSQAATTLP